MCVFLYILSRYYAYMTVMHIQSTVCMCTQPSTLSLHPSTHSLTHPHLSISISIYTHLSIYHPLTHLLLTYPSIHQPIHIPIYLHTHPSSHPSTHHPIYLFIPSSIHSIDACAHVECMSMCLISTPNPLLYVYVIYFCVCNDSICVNACLVL